MARANENIAQTIEMSIEKVTVGAQEAGFHPVTLATNRGDVECRYYPVAKATAAVLWVGGAGGGWGSPAKGLYPRMCRELTEHNIASLHVRYRQPADVVESVLDVLAGITYLESEGIEQIGLAGHSFGGAVVIQAAAISQLVKTIVALASQTYGAEPAAELGPRCSILLLHGTGDRVLPFSCSQHIHNIAKEPKRLVLYKKANHGLDEVAEEVHTEVYNWLLEKLAPEKTK